MRQRGGFDRNAATGRAPIAADTTLEADHDGRVRSPSAPTRQPRSRTVGQTVGQAAVSPGHVLVFAANGAPLGAQ